MAKGKTAAGQHGSWTCCENMKGLHAQREVVTAAQSRSLPFEEVPLMSARVLSIPPGREAASVNLIGKLISPWLCRTGQARPSKSMVPPQMPKARNSSVAGVQMSWLLMDPRLVHGKPVIAAFKFIKPPVTSSEMVPQALTKFSCPCCTDVGEYPEREATVLGPPQSETLRGMLCALNS